ncbi:hypothetical protein M3231_24970 [Neobacillus mesonae]|nr:hypothetical protein [Neobacillus mesonae]
MTIERFFNNECDLTLEDILLSLVDDRIDTLVKQYYDNDRVNTITSQSERKVAA